MSTNAKTDYTPPEEQAAAPTASPKPDRNNIIKNELKLLLMLAAIYSLIINQAQKKIPGEAKQSGKNKNQLTQKKTDGEFARSTASFLLFKE